MLIVSVQLYAHRMVEYDDDDDCLITFRNCNLARVSECVCVR